MSEVKLMFAYIVFNVIVFGLGLSLPKIVEGIKPLKKLVRPAALEMLQGVILAYGLIFGLLMPITSFLGDPHF